MTENNDHKNSVPTPQEQQDELEMLLNPSEKVYQGPPGDEHLKCSWAIILFLLLVAAITFFPAIGVGMKDMFTIYSFAEAKYELADFFEQNREMPEIEKWCDYLLKGNRKYYFLEKHVDHKDEFPYALNKHILDQNDIPDDMVMLFSGVSGWNMIGDHSLAKNKEHIKVLFGNGDIRKYRLAEIPYLKWKPQDSGIIPKPDVKLSLLTISGLLGIIFMTILIRCRKGLLEFWLLALIMGILAAGAGSFLGAIAESAYYMLRTNMQRQPLWISIIWGAVTGITFSAILGTIYKKYDGKVSMVGYATALGGITGFIASAIIHGYLMIFHEEKNFSFLLYASASFGTIAGLLLGLISAGLLTFHPNNQSESATTTPQI